MILRTARKILTVVAVILVVIALMIEDRWNWMWKESYESFE